MLYRVKQFMWAITAKLTEEEKQFIKIHLSDQEVRLFWQLKVYEQKHSVMVAKALAQCCQPQNRAQMIRVGLLHDVGKSVHPIGPIRKSIMVLLHRFTDGKIQQLEGLNMVKCYYKHPDEGARLLREIGDYEADFLQLVSAHHQELLEPSKEMKLLQECDDQA